MHLNVCDTAYVGTIRMDIKQRALVAVIWVQVSIWFNFGVCSFTKPQTLESGAGRRSEIPKSSGQILRTAFDFREQAGHPVSALQRYEPSTQESEWRANQAIPANQFPEG